MEGIAPFEWTVLTRTEKIEKRNKVGSFSLPRNMFNILVLCVLCKNMNQVGLGES